MKITKLFLLINTIIIATFIAAGFNSCKKENKAPDINIIEPISADTIQLSVSNEMHIEFTASDDNAIHDLRVYIINESGIAIYSDTSINVNHAKSYSYHEHIAMPGSTSIKSYSVKIDATDEEGLNTQKNVVVYTKP